MDVEAAEFQDWEILPSNGASDSEPLTPADSVGNTNGVDEVGSETGGVIQSNYFSLDSQSRYMSTFTGADGSEEDSEESENPSWIDPGSENNKFTIKTCREFWSDSSSELSETRKFSEFEGKNELGFEGIEEIKSENGKSLEEFWPDSVKFDDFEAGQNSHLQDGSDGSAEEKEDGEKKIEVEERDQKRSLVWWKLPIQLVKYCAAFRVSPLWTFPVAAAVMAFVILGRRLYKMKKKTKGLQLKVTVDDKNVSQFTSRAARLNEAFSIVKRVPVIRPQLPAAGDTLWPLMTLR
ncbi:uncharacterized protein LOC129892529 [Solanum dulcamara]|uniref:uncharacterized protein LOC129892529 n=1 Tax=Solanum dulcamara TaxID=45834 RepID=UPI002485495A|nr:uncharacterized protein LOC129892529 [Solanum dulcamara]